MRPDRESLVRPRAGPIVLLDDPRVRAALRLLDPAVDGQLVLEVKAGVVRDLNERLAVEPQGSADLPIGKSCTVHFAVQSSGARVGGPARLVETPQPNRVCVRQ